jgi:hypothetical protein
MFNKKILLLLTITLLVTGCQINTLFPVSSLPIEDVKQDCVIIQPELPVGFLASGTILLGDFSERASIGQIMTLTSNSGQPIYLSDVPVATTGATSPDNELFAYSTIGEDNSSTLIVLDVNGKVEFTLPWDEKWGGFYWLNNKQLEFPYFWGGYWQGASPVSDIINVLTGQREILAPSITEPWIPGGPLVPLLVVWKTAYDPTLSVVGYMRGEEPEQSFVLWDLKNNRELWKLDKWSTRTIHPAWTPDGKNLAVAVLNQKEDNWDRFELYLVGRDGQAEKWIDIKGYFKNVSLNISWSPNNRFLAIVPNEGQSFLILDTVTRELLDYCIPADSGFASGIWSPDSSQILIARQSDSSYPSIVFDVNNNRAAYLTNDPKFVPLGWLINYQH